MKKTLLMLSIFSIFGLATSATASSSAIQGEPVKVVIDGRNFNDIKDANFEGQIILPNKLDDKAVFFIGIDLNKKPGTYPLLINLKNSKTLTQYISVLERKKETAPLGIPSKLGGNTSAAATNLVSNLSKENALLNSLWSNSKQLWSKKFKFPLKEIVVTDSYGYSRETGQYNIAHKGTDFRAKEGAKIYAMNRGVVRLAENFTVYGNTVVIDHGRGVMSFYMHLSKIDVKEGALVSLGEVIGRSGSTGYAESPHLHLSVRINNISIDPMKFMEFFK